MVTDASSRAFPAAILVDSQVVRAGPWLQQVRPDLVHLAGPAHLGYQACPGLPCLPWGPGHQEPPWDPAGGRNTGQGECV